MKYPRPWGQVPDLVNIDGVWGIPENWSSLPEGAQPVTRITLVTNNKNLNTNERYIDVVHLPDVYKRQHIHQLPSFPAADKKSFPEYWICLLYTSIPVLSIYFFNISAHIFPGAFLSCLYSIHIQFAL